MPTERVRKLAQQSAGTRKQRCSCDFSLIRQGAARRGETHRAVEPTDTRIDTGLLGPHRAPQPQERRAPCIFSSPSTRRRACLIAFVDGRVLRGWSSSPRESTDPAQVCPQGTTLPRSSRKLVPPVEPIHIPDLIPCFIHFRRARGCRYPWRLRDGLAHTSLLGKRKTDPKVLIRPH